MFKTTIAWIAFAGLAVSAFALDTVTLLPAGASKTLLEKKKPILAEASGEVPVVFTNALAVFGRPTLLQDVQDAYCAQIADDHQPEFTIQQSAANSYFYVNKDGDRTDITEVLRRQTSSNAYDLVYYTAGKRFFGKYQAVIHVRICGDVEGKSRYMASVYAYPENAFSRFFARHLGLVDHFFKSKTAEMTGIITTISCSLCETKTEPSPDEKPGPDAAPLLSDL